MIKDRITEYFDSHKAEMLSRLAALCAIPSVQSAPEAGKPFGTLNGFFHAGERVEK